MTDKEYRDLKKRLEKIIYDWHGALGLGWWNMEYLYNRDGKPPIYSEDTNYCTVMTCEAKWPYLKATIEINMPPLLGLDDETLEADLVHEWMHVFLNEMSEKNDKDHKHEERVATQLAKAFIWTRDKGRKEAK